MLSELSMSAIVLDTFNILSYALAERFSRFIACPKIFILAGSALAYKFSSFESICALQ